MTFRPSSLHPSPVLFRSLPDQPFRQEKARILLEPSPRPTLQTGKGLYPARTPSRTDPSDRKRPLSCSNPLQDRPFRQEKALILLEPSPGPTLQTGKGPYPARTPSRTNPSDRKRPLSCSNPFPDSPSSPITLKRAGNRPLFCHNPEIIRFWHEKEPFPARTHLIARGRYHPAKWCDG